MSTIVWIHGRPHRITSGEPSALWIRGRPEMVFEQAPTLQRMPIISDAGIHSVISHGLIISGSTG
jgi:hypothetical protein